MIVKSFITPYGFVVEKRERLVYEFDCVVQLVPVTEHFIRIHDGKRYGKCSMCFSAWEVGVNNYVNLCWKDHDESEPGLGKSVAMICSKCADRLDDKFKEKKQ